MDLVLEEGKSTGVNRLGAAALQVTGLFRIELAFGIHRTFTKIYVQRLMGCGLSFDLLLGFRYTVINMYISMYIYIYVHI